MISRSDSFTAASPVSLPVVSCDIRLDQQPGSRWRPQLSPAHFQILLQNLTAIKVRATFGENGEGTVTDTQRRNLIASS